MTDMTHVTQLSMSLYSDHPYVTSIAGASLCVTASFRAWGGGNVRSLQLSQNHPQETAARQTRTTRGSWRESQLNRLAALTSRRRPNH